MDNIILYGASGHGKVIKDVVDSIKGKVCYFIDDDSDKSIFLGIPVLHSLELIEKSNYQCIVSVGNNAIRKKIVEKLDISYITLVDDSAIISSSSYLDKGTVIMPSVVINAATKIGKHVIINTSSIIEHDCTIKDYVHISPNATITGGVTIGEGTHVGAGVTVIPGVNIGKWATIGAGAVIIKDVPDFATVVGNPGKVIKIKTNQNE